MMAYVWLGVLVFSIIIEAVTVQLVGIWFMPGAIGGFIVAMCGGDLLWQLVVFLVISVGCFTFLRKPLRKLLLRKPYEPTNTDRYIGQVAIVSEDIDNDAAKGAAKVFGEEWSARSKDGSTIPAGTKVKVVSIEGVKLICELK